MNNFAQYLKFNGCFIIKNTSPSRKTFKVFNIPVRYNTTYDILSIPGISEDDIRASLLKGELRNRIAGGEITVICSDINLLQYNDSHRTFLLGAGITDGVKVGESQVDSSVSLSGGQGITVVADISELEALNTNGFENGIFVYVRSLKDNFRLDKTSSDTTDGITVITANPTGRLFREPTFTTHFLSQTEWNIDPTSGDDEGDGNSTPLKTIKEFNRRFWCHPGGGNILVNILSELPSDDPPKFLGDYSFFKSPDIIYPYTELDKVVFNGFDSVIATGTCSDGTIADHSTNDVWSITDSSKTWSDYIGDNFAIKFTSGNNINMYSFPMKDLGSGRVQITTPSLKTITTTSENDDYGTSAPLNGDTYQIVSFVDCGSTQLTRAKNNAINPINSYQKIFFSGNNISGTKAEFLNGFCDFRNCIVNYKMNFTTNQFHNDIIGTCFTNTEDCLDAYSKSTQLNVEACGFHGSVRVSNDSKIVLSKDTVTLTTSEISFGTLVLNGVISVGTGTAFRLTGSPQSEGTSNLILINETDSTLIGSGWTNIFSLSGDAKVRMNYDNLNDGLYSITCSSSVINFNGFGFARPSQQSVDTIPTLEIIQVLPTSIAELNESPWLLPAIEFKMPATIAFSSPDNQANVLAI